MFLYYFVEPPRPLTDRWYFIRKFYHLAQQKKFAIFAG